MGTHTHTHRQSVDTNGVYVHIHTSAPSPDQTYARTSKPPAQTLGVPTRAMPPHDSTSQAHQAHRYPAERLYV